MQNRESSGQRNKQHIRPIGRLFRKVSLSPLLLRHLRFTATMILQFLQPVWLRKIGDNAAHEFVEQGHGEIQVAMSWAVNHAFVNEFCSSQT